MADTQGFFRILVGDSLPMHRNIPYQYVTENHGVGGSIPPLGTIFIKIYQILNQRQRAFCLVQMITAMRLTPICRSLVLDVGQK